MSLFGETAILYGLLKYHIFNIISLFKSVSISHWSNICHVSRALYPVHKSACISVILFV